MNSKKIIIISPSNKTGGKATFTKRLVEMLNQTEVDFKHIDLVRAKSNKLYFRYLQHSYSFISYKIQFVKELLTSQINVVQIHTSSWFDFYDLSIFLLISKLFRKEIVLRCGGGAFPKFYKESYPLNKIYIRKILNSADKIVVQSIYWSIFFQKIGVEKERLYIVPNFVDYDQHDTSNKDFHKKNLHVLFMPGLSLEGKGFFDIKNKIIELADKYPSITFHIVGPKVGDHIFADNIITYKEIYGEEKAKLFNMCHIFLLPTRVEGFPNTLIEAMAAGMAVITTNIPQISCLAEDGKEFLLMNPGSSTEFEGLLIGLMNDKNRIKELATNARKLVEQKYSQKLMAGYLKELYNG